VNVNTTAGNLLALLCLFPGASWAYDINDGHLHYNQIVWKDLPADQALGYMTESGIDRAIVSSTPAEGTEQLYRLAGDRIIPFIRPYRSLKDVLTWHSDPEIVTYVKQKVATGIFRGFGEFHMWIEHMEGSILPELMQIYKFRGRVL